MNLWSFTVEDNNYLLSAKTGTQVVVYGSAYQMPALRLSTIEDTTPTRVRIDGYYYHRKNGLRVGDKWGTSIYQPTTERLLAVEQAKQEYLEERERRKLSKKIMDFSINGVPIETLRSIVKLMYPVQEKD
jgi:hypothetical protein